VIGVHAGQVANLVTDHELDHTDDASESTHDIITRHTLGHKLKLTEGPLNIEKWSASRSLLKYTRKTSIQMKFNTFFIINMTTAGQNSIPGVKSLNISINEFKN